MPPYIDVFISPIRDNLIAQILTVALFILAALDVAMGVVNAWFIQRNFSSHELRAGLIRKLANFGLMLTALVLDGMLLGGLDLGFQPLYVAVASLLAMMEVASLLELFAEMHPDLADSEIYRMLKRGKTGFDADAKHMKGGGDELQQASELHQTQP